MKASSVFLLVVLMLGTVLAVSLPAQGPIPSIKSVDPMSGKVGDTVKATGENLSKQSVVQVFLTDGKNDIPCEIMDQTATAIAFKIPAKATPMRYSVAVLTPGKEPKFIEQPVRLEVVP
jgi:IPT/TIG domain